MEIADYNGVPSNRAALEEEKWFPRFKHHARAANWDDLIWTAGKLTTDEDKTHIEPNYPIPILIYHTLGLRPALISYRYSDTGWVALSGAGPIREPGGGREGGWGGRWVPVDV